jgi:type I restriction enzyme S subunit
MKSYLPKNWSVKKAAEYCLRVTDGTHDTPKPIDEGKLLITSKNIKEGRVQLDGAYAISQNEFDEINRRSKVDQWDVLFSMIGTVGEIALVRDNPEYAIKNIGLFKSKAKVDGVWLYYYLTSSIGKAALNTYLTGTSQQFVSLGDLRKVPVIDPVLTSKVKVSAILAAYDDLIENNRRRIALLEKLAEEIYREWFVRMRFPRYEQAKFEKGVPEGWEVRTLDSLAGEIRKSVKKRNLPDDALYVGLEHIPRRSISLKECSTADTVDSDKQAFQKMDILFGKIRPYLHKVALAHFAGVCSSDTIVIRPRQKAFEGYVLFTVFSETFIELASVASKGTKMPRADWDFLKKLKLTVPSVVLLEEFQSRFDSMFGQIVYLLRANENLKATRDRLLIRLISGKLNVETLDIQFPPGMLKDAEEKVVQSAHA